MYYVGPRICDCILVMISAYAMPCERVDVKLLDLAHSEKTLETTTMGSTLQFCHTCPIQL